jgi:hypothetical protein
MVGLVKMGKNWQAKPLHANLSIRLWLFDLRQRPGGVYHKTFIVGKRVGKSYLLYFDVIMLIDRAGFPKIAETPPLVEGFP